MSWARSASRLVVVLATLLVLTNAVAFVAVHQLFPWLSLFPEVHQSNADSHTHPVTLHPVLKPAGPSPAQKVVEAVLAVQPRELRAPWQATAAVQGVSRSAFASDCGQQPEPGPVVAASRGWAQSSGPLPGSITKAVNVETQAYGAGEGAYAYQQYLRQLQGCPSTFVGSAPSLGKHVLGVESNVVSVGSRTLLLWRRGDVVMLATLDHVGVTQLAGVWTRIDRTLHAALAPVCTNEQSTAADVVRSPYADRATFRGLGDPSQVLAPVTTPQPLPQSQPGQVQVSRVPIPGPSIPVPTVPYQPTPTPPVTPAAMPQPVASPSMPTAPKRPPGQVTVFLRRADPTGPGCGWSFTRQQAPAFDAANARNNYAQERVDTANRLKERWTTWQQQKIDYYVAYATYAAQMKPYQSYVSAATQVAEAWAQVQSVRDAYDSALATWKAAVAAHQQFFVDRRHAQARYNQELAACNGQPSPSSSPSPTTGPPNAQRGKGATKHKKPPPAQPTCPPRRPAILSQSPPPIPPEPAAPDASYPEWQNPGHLFHFGG